ncbi:hypothetical protein D3C71_1919850 [compost metagenome]
MQIIDLARLRQRGQRYAAFPRHAGFEGGEFLVEFLDKKIDHVFVHEENFQRGAALAIERQRAGDGFVDGVVQINLRQHDAGVLRVQP